MPLVVTNISGIKLEMYTSCEMLHDFKEKIGPLINFAAVKTISNVVSLQKVGTKTHDYIAVYHVMEPVRNSHVHCADILLQTSYVYPSVMTSMTMT